MHIKMPTEYVDPRTQTPLPDAVLAVVDTEFRLRAGDTRVICALYPNEAAIGVAQPLAEYPISLGPSERDAQLPALLTALYQTILVRPEMAGAVLVT